MKTLLTSALLITALTFGASPAIAADKPAIDDYMPSLITATPLEGRLLAITIVRKTIGTIQQDGKIKHDVRKKYQDDPELLMRAAELVTMEFEIIAKANNYWRD